MYIIQQVKIVSEKCSPLHTYCKCRSVIKTVKKSQKILNHQRKIWTPVQSKVIKTKICGLRDPKIYTTASFFPCTNILMISVVQLAPASFAPWLWVPCWGSNANGIPLCLFLSSYWKFCGSRWQQPAGSMSLRHLKTEERSWTHLKMHARFYFTRLVILWRLCLYVLYIFYCLWTVYFQGNLFTFMHYYYFCFKWDVIIQFLCLKCDL